MPKTQSMSVSCVESFLSKLPQYSRCSVFQDSRGKNHFDQRWSCNVRLTQLWQKVAQSILDIVTIPGELLSIQKLSDNLLSNVN